ncbi:unnamed protein product [Amoebophrya sp. A25]|nr:unnamed protein product [Amoebophrya sp. A25]|eukprot:GSA25T00023116001.1
MSSDGANPSLYPGLQPETQHLANAQSFQRPPPTNPYLDDGASGTPSAPPQSPGTGKGGGNNSSSSGGGPTTSTTFFSSTGGQGGVPGSSSSTGEPSSSSSSSSAQPSSSSSSIPPPPHPRSSSASSSGAPAPPAPQPRSSSSSSSGAPAPPPPPPGGSSSSPSTAEQQPAPPVEHPSEFVCPISQELMADPVIAEDGQTYDRQSIADWFSLGHRTSPVTRANISQALIPNRAVKSLIEDYCKTHKIPQPVAPPALRSGSGSSSSGTGPSSSGGNGGFFRSIAEQLFTGRQVNLMDAAMQEAERRTTPGATGGAAAPGTGYAGIPPPPPPPLPPAPPGIPAPPQQPPVLRTSGMGSTTTTTSSGVTITSYTPAQQSPAQGPVMLAGQGSPVNIQRGGSYIVQQPSAYVMPQVPPVMPNVAAGIRVTYDMAGNMQVVSSSGQPLYTASNAGVTMNVGGMMQQQAAAMHQAVAMQQQAMMASQGAARAVPVSGTTAPGSNTGTMSQNNAGTQQQQQQIVAQQRQASVPLVNVGLTAGSAGPPQRIRIRDWRNIRAEDHPQAKLRSCVGNYFGGREEMLARVREGADVNYYGHLLTRGDPAEDRFGYRKNFTLLHTAAVHGRVKLCLVQ